MKICSKCKQQKILSEFYNDKNRRGGKSARCKKCDHKYTDVKRKRNPEKLRERNRLHSKTYSLCPENKIKILTRMKTRKAVKDGILLREKCLVCGEDKVEIHHNDYSKPLEIMWLCKKHHSMVHRIN